YPNFVKGIVAFSPGEYFPYNDKSIVDYAKKVKVPVFITSTKSEKVYWESIYDNLNSPKQFYLPETEGFHGSKALWSKNEGSKEYWKALNNYLSQF
ncbi:MAG TPA: hypothetical protein VJ970_01645, partial [Flavobacteriaceae bacterium]|nr:hypothetical protein [Flavobacteriaceae bacterium]